jgi:hypothetical protein
VSGFQRGASCEGRLEKFPAGRKPFDVVLMFKGLVLQTTYNLADEQVEYQIRDRLSFGRFLGLGIEDRVPAATTVWNFRDRLKALGLTDTQQHGRQAHPHLRAGAASA